MQSTQNLFRPTARKKLNALAKRRPANVANGRKPRNDKWPKERRRKPKKKKSKNETSFDGDCPKNRNRTIRGKWRDSDSGFRPREIRTRWTMTAAAVVNISVEIGYSASTILWNSLNKFVKK